MRVVWKHHPLAGLHKDARKAHIASQAAHEQGKFWEYHDKVFANAKDVKPETLLRYAQELNLDLKAFQAALDSPKTAAVVDADTAEAESMGATGTPAFFVNGRYMFGAKPLEEFSKVINEELKKLNLPVPSAAAAAPADGKPAS